MQGSPLAVFLFLSVSGEFFNPFDGDVEGEFRRDGVCVAAGGGDAQGELILVDFHVFRDHTEDIPF